MPPACSGPDLQLVHPLNTDAADWEALAKHGTHYSTSPLGEAARTGEMQFIEMMQAGVPVSISVDNVTAEHCDCFSCMHMLQTVNRHRTGGKLKLTNVRSRHFAAVRRCPLFGRYRG
jgi:cytosine/adenosine deaminase-related metal-dependent hydrolase